MNSLPRGLKKFLAIKGLVWTGLFLMLAGFAFLSGDAFAAEGAVSVAKEVSTGKGLLAIGAGLAFGISAIGTGFAQAKIGSAGVGAMAEKPELKVLVIVLIAIPETMAILGFVVAAMMMTMLVG